MAVLIGHASISEHGTINGTRGDQTGKEVCIRSWYSKPWNVMLVCTDKELARKAAQEMRYACANNNIGYGQNDRRTAYESAVKNGRTFKNAKGNTDCSQLAVSCYILAGLTQLSPDCYTGNMRKALLNTGKFKEYIDSAHLKLDSYAEEGALYLKEGSHVVMALENGSNSGSSGSAVDTSTKEYWIKQGQHHANNYASLSLLEDGIVGTQTRKARIKVLQRAMNDDYESGLAEDGIWGTKSNKALGNHTVRRGECQYMITALEILLMLKGYDPHGIECPGQFGSGLESTVREYQGDSGLSVDGIAGRDTYISLIV